MQKLLCFLLMMTVSVCKAQSIGYNQYNAVLAAINPAYIARIEADYITLLGRSQWPGTGTAAHLGTFAYSRSTPKINSCFGITLDALAYKNQPYARGNVGLQYGWHVIFLNSYYLNFGASVNYTQEMIGANGFYDGAPPPPHTYFTSVNTFNSQNVYASYGIIIQPDFGRWYAGFSLRNQWLNVFHNSTFRHKNTFSIQAMKSIPITRRLSLYGFFSIEHSGPITSLNEEKTLLPAYNLFVVQGNLAYYDRWTFGMGYKYFSGRYGSLCYRGSFTTGASKKNRYRTKPAQRLTIGLSSDARPYLRNHQFRLFPSYEIFLKYKINHPNP